MHGIDYRELLSMLDAKDFTAAYDEVTERKPLYQDICIKLAVAYWKYGRPKAVLDHFATLDESRYSIDVTSLDSELMLTYKAGDHIITRRRNYQVTQDRPSSFTQGSFHQEPSVAPSTLDSNP